MLSLIGKLLAKNYLKTPIFVVGAGRSGTDAILQALGEHPLILSIAGEYPFIPYFGSLVAPFEFHSARKYFKKNIRMPNDELYNEFQRLCFESTIGKNYGLKTILMNLWRSDFPSQLSFFENVINKN